MTGNAETKLSFRHFRSYLAKYQAPMTLENTVLIIPLETAQLQSQMAVVPTPRHVDVIPNLQWYFQLSSHSQRVLRYSVTYVTKCLLKKNL